MAVLGEQMPKLQTVQALPQKENLWNRLEFSQVNWAGTQSHCDLGSDECDQWGMGNAQVWVRGTVHSFCLSNQQAPSGLRPSALLFPLPDRPVTVSVTKL